MDYKYDKKHNCILYYADFLSLKYKNIPVTDNCKYYFIFNSPINSAYIIDQQPNYNQQNEYIKMAKDEYDAIEQKYGGDGAISFINNICNIQSCGAVDAILMLKCINKFNSSIERKQAISTYYKWKNNQKYTHQIINENGDIEERECTRFVYNAEKNSKFNKISKGALVYTNVAEENIKNDK